MAFAVPVAAFVDEKDVAAGFLGNLPVSAEIADCVAFIAVALDFQRSAVFDVVVAACQFEPIVGGDGNLFKRSGFLLFDGGLVKLF